VKREQPPERRGPEPPVRVEQALRLLPELEALVPLRALVVSASRPEEQAQWASVGPYLTVGKRAVEPAELRRRAAQAAELVRDHVGALYAAYVDAVEHHQRGDAGAAVAALRQAGSFEERVGRLPQARAWYETALALAEGLQDRRPEIEVLLALGALEETLGRHAEAARHHQRALALAEAEFHQAGAIAACLGLGAVALAQGQWAGARAWFARGMRLADAADDGVAIGRLHHRLAELAHRTGDPAAAGEHLRQARERLEPLGGEVGEMARVLNTQGLVDARLGRETAAVAAYREALAWARRGPRDASQEVAIRLNLATLHLEAGRFLEAEEEARRAEQVAVTHGLTSRLVRTYLLMGRLRGRQRDDTGFVFFEQAIQLCQTLDRSPALAAEVYHEYGLFRSAVGDRDEARAYLERAREIFESLGETVQLALVREELQQISA
jgi:tetratricopeptide (TPR) repeat protein